MAFLVQLVDDKIFAKHEIPNNGITIGRSIKNDILLDDPSVSQQHAKIEVKTLQEGGEIFFIVDLNSTNHLFVNGKQVEELPLSHDDMINIGTNFFRFLDQENEQLAQTKAFKKSWLPGMYVLK